MTTILHISGDYPDAFQPVKTRAIAALVDGSADRFGHVVYSLNRVGGWRGWLRPGTVAIIAENGAVRTCTYAAPARGFWLGRAMNGVADALAADLKRRGEAVDLVHGHKLSIEGLAAHRLACRLRLPFMLTIQGNTDQKILRARPDLRRRWRRCWHEAEQIISFAPWAAAWVGRKLDKRQTPPTNVPCIVASDELIAPAEAPAVVRTAFHLGDWRNKNVATLAAAMAIARVELPELRLEIAGGGSADAEAEVDAILALAGVSDITNRVGAVAPDTIQKWMNGAAVFVLPSRRETFGMVFVEALLAGCPIIHSRGTAVDGYFDGATFVRSVDAVDERQLAAAIVHFIRHQGMIKAALGQWQEEGGAAPFRRDAIIENYSSLVRESVR